MKNFDTTEFAIGSHYLSALINDDYSGLTDEESEELDSFYSLELHQGNAGGHWSHDSDGESYFTVCDISGMRGDCVTVFWVFPIR